MTNEIFFTGTFPMVYDGKRKIKLVAGAHKVSVSKDGKLLLNDTPVSDYEGFYEISGTVEEIKEQLKVIEGENND